MSVKSEFRAISHCFGLYDQILPQYRLEKVFLSERLVDFGIPSALDMNADLIIKSIAGKGLREGAVVLVQSVGQPHQG